ncbi:peroxin [Nowakowskiella sp. JEL0407]|nr:peroxin [Nowakowskiella sp. JEL0407]
MNFLYRNRKRLLWTGAIVGGIYAVSKYIHYKIIEAEHERELEKTAKANAKKRFEQNQQDCALTILSLLPTLSEQIFVEYNVEAILAKLQERRHNNASKDENSKVTKYEMWGNMKLMSFSRTITSIYVVTLLSIFTYLQLNLLGRFIYLDSVTSFTQHESKEEIEGNEARGLSADVERKYLTFSWFLLNKGWKNLAEVVNVVVKENIENLSLKEGMTYSAVLEIVKKIRSDIDSRVEFSTFLLPAEGNEEEVLQKGGVQTESMDEKTKADLKKLLDETRDFLDSPDFTRVVSSCLEKSFETAFSQINPNFVAMVGASSSAEVGSTETSDAVAQVKTVAEIIPMVSRIAHLVINGLPNELVEKLKNHAELKAFSVIVYTGWEA